MTRIIAIIALCLPMLAHAWTDTQKALYLSAQVATVIDWAQTRHIAKNPDKFQEVNPLIGKNPSTNKVDAFMAGRMVANHLIARGINDRRFQTIPCMHNKTGGYVAVRITQALQREKEPA